MRIKEVERKYQKQLDLLYIFKSIYKANLMSQSQMRQPHRVLAKFQN